MALHQEIEAVCAQLELGPGQDLANIIIAMLNAESDAALKELVAGTPSELLSKAVRVAKQILPHQPPQLQSNLRFRLETVQWLRKQAQ